MEQIAQFNAADLNNAMVEFVPARVAVTGKTATEKRLSVITVASTEVQLFAANMKGKVGAAARNGLFEEGFNRIASAAARGNYKPLAEALALLQGEHVYITNRASFESLGDRYEAKLDELEASGKKYTKGSEEKLTSKFLMYTQCLSLVSGVHAAVEAVFAQRNDGAAE